MAGWHTASSLDRADTCSPLERWGLAGVAPTLLEIYAKHGHTDGLKIGLDALERLESSDWIEQNKDRLFMAASGADNSGLPTSIAALRMLDKCIGMKGLGCQRRRQIVEGLVFYDHEPHLRVIAARMFLDGPDTLPSPSALESLAEWKPGTSRHVAAMVDAMINNGLDPTCSVRDGMDVLGMLNQSHPQAAAMIGARMMSITPTPCLRPTATRRM